MLHTEFLPGLFYVPLHWLLLNIILLYTVFNHPLTVAHCTHPFLS